MTAITAPNSAILLVGHPNVGKSVLFHRLTGAYVNVSNYPGTTVEVTRASARFDREAVLLDTPGVLSLPSRSDDERATMRRMLHRFGGDAGEHAAADFLIDAAIAYQNARAAAA